MQHPRKRRIVPNFGGPGGRFAWIPFSVNFLPDLSQVGTPTPPYDRSQKKGVVKVRETENLYALNLTDQPNWTQWRASKNKVRRRDRKSVV